MFAKFSHIERFIRRYREIPSAKFLQAVIPVRQLNRQSVNCTAANRPLIDSSQKAYRLGIHLLNVWETFVQEESFCSQKMDHYLNPFSTVKVNSRSIFVCSFNYISLRYKTTEAKNCSNFKAARSIFSLSIFLRYLLVKITQTAWCWAWYANDGTY